MTIQIAGMTVALFVSCGCIAVRHQPPADSWPQPQTISDTKQFEGMFSNRSVDRSTGQPGERTAQLFDFLTGRGHSHGKRGVSVEMRCAEEGAMLFVRLFDDKGLEIDSARLQRGTDFEFEDGSLRLFGPFSGTHSRSGNLGAGVERQSSRLYVASSQGLLGRSSESGAGLLFYFVPYVGGSKAWMFWPKPASQ